jgi:hypothetical protein
VLRRVGLGLSRVPLEHAFSIYESRGPAGTPCCTRVLMPAASYASKFDPFLCQNCVRYHGTGRSNTVICGDTPMHIVVAGSRWWELRWCVSMCVSTRGRNLFPSVLLHPPSLAFTFSASSGEMSRRSGEPRRRTTTRTSLRL